MNQWANTVITEKGTSLLAKLTQGNTLHITRAVTGAGFVTPGLLTKQTAVATPKQELTFKAVSYPEEGKCSIPVVLKNDAVATGYKATQVGIYATDPDEGEILLFISQAADEASGTIIPSATEMPGYSAEWTFYLQYGHADGVNVTVDPSNTVSKAELEEHTKNTNNPHNVTKAQVGLANVDNTSDADKPVSTAQAKAIAEAKKAGTDAQTSLTNHNTDTASHNDLRLDLKALADRINAVLDSDDTTLDELSEIVAYIKSNKALIDAITTSKVSITDIVDNLETNVSNKPLSAAQGVVLMALITALQTQASETVPVSKGGTGATSASAARTNLGITPANIGAASNANPKFTGGVTLNEIVGLALNADGIAELTIKHKTEEGNSRKLYLAPSDEVEDLKSAIMLGDEYRGLTRLYKLYGEHNPNAGALHQDPNTSLLRNSKLVNAETNPTVNGEICWTYE